MNTTQNTMPVRGCLWWNADDAGWQSVTFDHESIEAARQHVAELFPRLRFTVGRAT